MSWLIVGMRHFAPDGACAPFASTHCPVLPRIHARKTKSRHPLPEAEGRLVFAEDHAVKRGHAPII
jgi:hypothetical protein